jgi:hypothetical protein
MTTLFINTEDKAVLQAVRALLNGFKVPFEEAKDKEYDPEFVAMVKSSEKQIKAGKTVKLEAGANLWDLVSSK